MDEVCLQSECTIEQTGRCLLNNNLNTCPNYRRRVIAEETGLEHLSDQLTVSIPDLPSPPARPRFHAGLELGLADASALMARRYCHLIGILGAPEAGKTAALVSLYLLIANAKLQKFVFADSFSVMAFEQLSRGVRRWNSGSMPGEMTAHTKLADPRSPGFLHLRVRRRGSVRTAYDLLLPDLPGEWTSELIDRNVHERLAFLRRADALWIMVDGTHLAQVKLRNYTIHRTKFLIARAAGLLDRTLDIPVILVITRRDAFDQIPTAALDAISAEARRHKLLFSSIEVASFSGKSHIAPGTGLEDVLEQTLARPRVVRVEPESHRNNPALRQVLRYVG